MSEDEMLAQMAKQPDTVWEVLVNQSPELMKGVDTMLSDGVTPEWICMRPDFLEMPVGVQTAILNAFHWRQDRLLKG